MIVSYDGREYSFEVGKIGVDEWRELKRKYQMTPKSFDQGMDEADPDAMTFAYWVMLRQNGQQTFPLGDALKPDIIALNNAFGEATKAEKAKPEQAAEPDPTQASPSTPTSSAPPSPPPSVPAAGGSLTA